MKNQRKTAKKYKKSTIQIEKERERRRKLRKYILNHAKPWILTQTKLATILDCSQATVSRDIAKLASSRWNPFRQLALRAEKTLNEEKEKLHDEIENWNTSMSIVERYKLVARLLSIQNGGHWYPEYSKPRGKPFSSDYQPRWGRWGFWSFQCSSCGYEDKVEIRGKWHRGQASVFKCPRCGEKVGVTRPELPISKRVFTTPCGLEIIVSIKGRWHRHTTLLFDCSKCGKEHRIEKRFTRPVT